MTLSTVLYVSHGTIAQDDAQGVVGNIVETSIRNNSRYSITGALLFTGTHFAQLLEGEEDNLALLMSAICADDRHQNVRIVDRGPLPERHFSDWSMAYCGRSQFVARHVTRLLQDPPPADQQRMAAWLTDLLREFSGIRTV